jgi:site-specific DNA-cytosine methylase
MEDLGESGATFEGMKRWIQKAQPPIVILENVYGTCATRYNLCGRYVYLHLD